MVKEDKGGGGEHKTLFFCRLRGAQARDGVKRGKIDKMGLKN
jgi:hypothetical protein